MKLRRENVLSPYRRRKCFPIRGLRGDNRCIRRARKKAVHEIDMAAIGDAAKQRARRLHYLELVPADLWNLQSAALGKTHYLPRENPQAGRATVEFLALFK